MELTASYIAACMIAKLRVGWIVAGCAPGVRTITKSVRFHCTTWLTGFVVSAITGQRLAAASAAIIVPASNRVFILDLTRVDMSASAAPPTWLEGDQGLHSSQVEFDQRVGRRLADADREANRFIPAIPNKRRQD